MPPPWFVDEWCRDLKIVSSFEALAVNATSLSVIVGSQVVPNSDAGFCQIPLQLTEKYQQFHMVRPGIYFFLFAGQDEGT